METVGDFKKAKLKFVVGDVIKNQFPDSKIIVGTHCSVGMLDVGINAGHIVASFADRKNTGVKPEFEGVIEYTFNGEGCEMREVRHTRNINWAIVKEWRPHLPVVKTKTPEAKPDSAFKVLGVDTEETYIELHEFVTDNNLKLQGETVSQCIIRELAEKHNIDARTDKEKCIDNALAVTGFSNSATAKQFICALYDKGLLKTEINQ